ncbi:hypothetical protein HYFRA_00003292 [Hymenoscyphus fraxineus]|uniref:Rhodopsin domain-containing protein n=1 Tax=Hymenoscyphus fraxineus TaxID=746836 RepID=A0A9N9KX53_9HELO|nr:hypothetical protein HYFRA_00003292 [Hymenoscyphus fraxineus]
MASSFHPTAASHAFLSQNDSTSLVVTAIVFIVLETIFYGLRTLSRYYQKIPFGWEDALMLLGWVTCLTLAADGIVSVRFGTGQRFLKVIQEHPEKIPSWGRNNLYAIPMIYCFAVNLPKMSVLGLYLGIFLDKWSRWTCWILLFVCGASGIVNFFTVAFQCNTPEAIWTPLLPGGRCDNVDAHITYSAIVNILTDLVMIILPISLVKKLQVTKKVKIGIALTFLSASIGLITAIARFIQFILNPIAEDPTYQGAKLIIWIIVESGMYLISGCLLSCRPVLNKIMSSDAVSTIFSTNRSASGRGTKATTGGTSGVSGHQGKNGDSTDGNKARMDESVEGGYYRLEPAKPGKIYVKRQFSIV